MDVFTLSSITLELFPHYCYWTYILLFGTIVTFYINREEIFQQFSLERSDAKKIAGVLFLALVIFSVFNQPYQIYQPSAASPLYESKEFMTGNYDAYLNYRYGLTFPCVMGGITSFFDYSIEAFNTLNIILGVFSVFLVFVLVDIIQDRTEISLGVSMAYIFLPQTIIFTSLLKDKFIFVQFFVLLSLTAFLLSYRIKKKTGYLMAVLVLSLVSQIKPEFMLFLGVFLTGFFIYNRRELLKELRKLVIPALALVLSSIPYYYKYWQRRKGGCRNVPQRPVWDSMPEISGNIDILLSKVMSPEFSIKFLPPNLLKYVQDFPMIFVFVPFALAGIYVFLKDVDKREDLIFLGAASGIIFLPYMVHCATYVRRDYLAFQTMILFPVLIIMAGVVTSFLREEFSESPIEKIIAISLGLAVIIISVSFYGSAYDINRPDRAREDIYHGETRDILPKNSTIIVPLLEPRKTLEFYGYRAYDFSGKEVIKECFHEADNRTEKKRCVNLESLGVEPEEGLYIWVSNTYMRGWDKVEHIISAYSFKEIKRGDYFHIYKLENASEDMR